MAGRLLIIEPKATGHRGVWLKWMAEGLAGKGWQVSVATLSDSGGHPSIRELSSAPAPVRIFASDLPHDFSPSGSGGLLRQDHAYRGLMRTLFHHAADAKPDVVLVPYLDYCLYSSALFGSPFGRTPWAGIALRPSFHYAACGIRAPKPSFARVREAMFSRLLSNRWLRTCLTIDQPLFEYWRRAHPRQAHKLSYMPDPIQPLLPAARETARQRMEVPKGHAAILVFGRIGERKGLDPLFAAADRLSQQHALCVLVVGEQDAGARQYLGSPAATRLRNRGLLIERSGWARPEIESDAFAACDIVWMGYQNHWQSSGVQIQAAMAGKPIAASDDGIIGWQTRHHECGLTLDVSNPQSVDTALHKLLSSESLRATRGENGRRFSTTHTTDNAVGLLDARLRAA